MFYEKLLKETYESLLIEIPQRKKSGLFYEDKMLQLTSVIEALERVGYKNAQEIANLALQ